MYPFFITMKTLFKITLTDKRQILVVANNIQEAEDRLNDMPNSSSVDIQSITYVAREIQSITYVAREIYHLDNLTKTNCLIIV